jgi:hypothetical protein
MLRGYCYFARTRKNETMSKETTTSRPRVTSNCLICEEHETAENRLRRGLCTRHYEQFRRAAATIPPAKLADFERGLIEAGKLLPNRQGQKGGDVNEFAAFAEQFLPERDRKAIDDGKRASRKLTEEPKNKGERK